MQIILSNLPDGIEKQDVEELVSEFAGVTGVEFMQEGEGEHFNCFVSLEEDDRVVLDSVAAQLNGRFWKGETISASVPLFQDDTDPAAD